VAARKRPETGCRPASHAPNRVAAEQHAPAQYLLRAVIAPLRSEIILIGVFLRIDVEQSERALQSIELFYLWIQKVGVSFNSGIMKEPTVRAGRFEPTDSEARENVTRYQKPSHTVLWVVTQIHVSDQGP
jgi:hypothetical protein